jgi:hypothetical protein
MFSRALTVPEIGHVRGRDQGVEQQSAPWMRVCAPLREFPAGELNLDRAAIRSPTAAPLDSSAFRRHKSHWRVCAPAPYAAAASSPPFAIPRRVGIRQRPFEGWQFPSSTV